MTNAGMMMRRIDDVGQHAGWFIALGVIYLIGGFIALVVEPFAASIAVALVIGWVLIFVGILTLVHAWQIRSWGGVLWEVIVGIVLLLGGISTLYNPVSAVLTFTLLIGIMFLIKGISQIILGFNMRPSPAWGWVLGAGILAALVGLMIIFSWPLSGAWVLGTLAGISLIFSGWSYISMATAARRLSGAM